MEFYQPLARIRDEIEGGAISIVKAGARITGLNCGGVRAPLLDMNSDQIIKLRTLINHGFDLVRSVN
jgi:5-dehydro-4-deoxyglucarate dehydratase